MCKSNSVWKTSLVQLNLLGRKGGRVHYLHFHLIKFQIVHLIRQSVALTQLVRPKTKPEIPSELCKLFFFFLQYLQNDCAPEWVLHLLDLKEPVESVKASVAFEAQHMLSQCGGWWDGNIHSSFVHYYNAFCVFPFAATAKPKQINWISTWFNRKYTQYQKKKTRKAKQSGKFKSKTKTTEDLRH